VRFFYQISFLFLFLLQASRADAQCNLSLSGKVLDQDNGSELGSTVLTIVETKASFVTGDHGRFSTGQLCPGKYTLLVQHLGCRDTLIAVDLEENTKLVIKLPHSAVELSEIDVMDKRGEVKETHQVNTIERAELDKTRGQSLGDALKSVSGVTTFNTGSTISKPMIHGMQGYRILILNNGIRQEGQQWGNEHAPEIDPFIAKKLSVIKGANSIRYGSDAIAGVILVEPDDLPDTAAVTGEVNLAGLSNGRTGVASAILQGYFDKLKFFSWRVQGTYKRGGSIRTPDYYLANTGMEEKNFSYALGYHRKKWGVEMYYSQFNTQIGIFTGSHIGNLTDLQNAYAMKKPTDSLAAFTYDIGRPYQDITHELVKGKLHYHFAPNWRFTTQYAWQYNMRKEYDLHVPLSQQIKALNKPDLDYRITSQTVEGIVEHDNIRSFRGQFGGSYMHQANVYLGRFFIPNFVNNTWGVFATERYLLPHVELEAGVRYDEKQLDSYYYIGQALQSPKLHFRNVTYNAGAIWKVDSTLNFFLNAGSAWRAPAPNELYSNGIHHGAGAIERGDSALKTEKVYNLTLTGIWKRRWIQAEVSAYHNQFQNYIYLNPSGTSELTIRGAFPVFNYLQTDARISGVDARSTLLFGRHVALTLKGMWVRGWNLETKDWLVYMPSDRGEAQLKYSFSLKRVLTENFVQFNSQFVSKQWRVPSGVDFAAPPPAYWLFGVDAGTTLKLGKQPLSLLLNITNLANTRYRDYLDRFRYFADAQGVSYNVKIKIPLVVYDKK